MEFKATFRHNAHTGKRDEALELAVLKSVAGFMNGRRGGTLLVGVADDTGAGPADRVLGLDNDIRLCGNRGLDGFENSLMTILGSAVGKVAAAAVDVSFERIGERDICRIDAPPASAPVYVTWKDNQLFFVRIGNSTRQFSIADAIDYISKRF